MLFRSDPRGWRAIRRKQSLPTTDDPALSETTVRHAKEDFLPLKDAATSARVRRHALRSMFVGRGTFWLSRHNDEVERFYPGCGLRCLATS